MREINVNELELYFETFGTSSSDLEIMQGVYILTEDSEKFVISIIYTLRNHRGNQSYRTYYDMLVKYYELCKQET